MKSFFIKVVFFFLAIVVIDMIVDLIFTGSVAETVLSGNVRSILIIIFVALIAAALSTVFDRKKPDGNRKE